MRPRDTGLPHPADGCPRCVGDFAVVPFCVTASGPGGVRCWYRCPRCLHSWWTGWDTCGMAGSAHYHPDSHGDSRCPCDCGVQLLRSPAATKEGDAA